MLAGAGYGTQAWFTSRSVSKENSIKSGILEVELGGQGAEEKTFAVSGLVQPGDIVTLSGDGTAGTAGAASIEVVNRGTLDLAAVSGFSISGASKLAEKLYFTKLAYSFLAKDKNGDWKDWKAPVTVIDDTGAQGGYTGLAEGDGHIYLSEWIDNENQCTGLSGGKYIAALTPSSKMVVTFELKFDENAGNDAEANDYSNLTLEGLYSARATQVKKPAIDKLLEAEGTAPAAGFTGADEKVLSANDISAQNAVAKQ